MVIGNPPYVRQEMIPDVLLAEYRSRYTTVYDRADLYIPFIERSLRLLSTGARLASSVLTAGRKIATAGRCGHWWPKSFI